ncbi:MAG: anthranilate synthase component I, partial [Firmicutes bacterium]|nr:anthranilate synthase component I [Bacillota bacterium]
MIFPNREEYAVLCRNYNLIPVSLDLPADTETPISVYLKVKPASPSFLLESVEGGEKLARYSFIGFDPFLTYRSGGLAGTVHCQGNGSIERLPARPLEALSIIMGRYTQPGLPGLPRFYGGAVGYLGYDAVRSLESLPMAAAGRLDLPDAWFLFPGTVLVFDHVRHILKVIVNSLPGDDPAGAFEQACTRIAGVES